MKILFEEMIGEYIEDKLILIDFESLETEYGHDDIYDNIREFSSISIEQKLQWFEELKRNFLFHQDQHEWDELYSNAKRLYDETSAVINFDHTDVSVDGHAGRWHSIMEVPNRWNNGFKEGEPFYLVKHDLDNKPYAIITEELIVVLHEAPNGFEELDTLEQECDDELEM